MLKFKISILTILNLFVFSNLSMASDLSSVSMPFIKNVGQAPKHVSYYINTPKAKIYIDNNNAINYNFEEKGKSVVVSESLINGKSKLTLGEKQQTQINVLKGRNKDKWLKNIPNASEINFGEVWNDIEVKLVSRPGNIEKLFFLKPQSSVDNIKVSLNGASSLSITDDGQLSVHTELGSVAFTQPIAWQEAHNKRIPVEVSYVIKENTYGFKLGDYDHSKTLIIDPLLAATYVGGNGSDILAGIHTNANNEIIVAGSTDSTNFPTSTGVLSSTKIGNFDLFAMKFNPDMSQLIAATYFGGSDYDVASLVTFDANDNIYFAGQSHSTDFPLPSMPYTPYQLNEDVLGSIFIAGLSADFTEPLGATFIGGDKVDMARSIDVAPNGNIYVTGFTNSSNYPYTIGALETSGKGIIISAFNPDLSELIASTRLGEGDGSTITIDTDGSVFVAGSKNGSSDYTTTTGVLNETPINSQGFQIYLAHLSEDLEALNSATFISLGFAKTILVAPNNELIINATTTGYPISPNAFDTSPAVQNNATLFKIDKSMTTLGPSSYIDLSIDSTYLESDGNILVFGSTSSQDFPGGNNPSPMNTGYNGGSSDFGIARFNADFTQVTHSSYLGGSNREFHAYGLTKDNIGNVIVAGRTESNDIETTPTAFDSTYNGGSQDIILLKSKSDLYFGPNIDNIFCDSFESPNANGACEE